MTRMRIGLAAFMTAIALSMPLAAHAQTVSSWQSDVTLALSGTVTVQETIVYDPEDGNHHGIIRLVPAQMSDTDGNTYYTTVALKSVVDDQGKPYPIAAQTIDRNGMNLQIGESSKLISSGPHYYIITYTITPLVTHTGDTDRLLLNIIGNNWLTTVTTASAEVHLPGTPQVTKTACFTGSAGSTQNDCVITQSGPDTLSAKTTRPLGAAEAFTVDISMQSEALQSYLVAGQRPPLQPLELATDILLALAQLGLCFGVGMLVVRALQQRSQRRNQTIIPIYEPPATLTPAHMSVLESPAADVADITATIIHLAVRGILKLEQIRPKSWWRAAGYRLTNLQPGASLAPFEATLVSAIFAGDTTVDLDNLGMKRQTLATNINTFREQLGADLTTQGYFLSSPTGWLKGTRLVAGFAVVVASVITGYWNSLGAPAAIIPGIITVIAAGLFIYVCRKPSGRTASGNKEWATIRGFKWFLEVTEKDRLNFTDAPEKTPELFSKMLPYAIALKVEKQWAKQFVGIDVSPAVGAWYGGYVGGSFSADTFTSTFASSFGSAMSSNFGGASGGGSAGGGGGGGGGGGW